MRPLKQSKWPSIEGCLSVIRMRKAAWIRDPSLINYLIFYLSQPFSNDLNNQNAIRFYLELKYSLTIRTVKLVVKLRYV